MIGQAMELADILKKHGPSPSLHELWHDAMPKILETVKIMDSKIEKMEAVVEAARKMEEIAMMLCDPEEMRTTIKQLTDSLKTLTANQIMRDIVLQRLDSIPSLEEK